MIPWLLTFLAVFAINVSYTHYIKATQDNKPYVASSWSALINLVASITAIGYIENHWLLIPSCLGSFLGTLAGMKCKK